MPPPDIDRLRSEFLASLSHDLRSPLIAIIGASELLKEGLAGDLTAEQGQFAGDILAAGRQLLSLIDDLLDLSSAEAGVIELDPEAVAVAPLLAAALAAVKEEAVRRRVQVEVEVEPGLPAVPADSRRLLQVVSSLAHAAVRLAPEGTRVGLSARAAADFIEVSAHAPGADIDPADLPRLFEAHGPLEGARSRLEAGTILRLALARRLVDLHGGTIGATSGSGAGATFTVRIPCREA